MFKTGDEVFLKTDRKKKMVVHSIINTDIQQRTLEQEPFILAGACDGDVLCDYFQRGKLKREYFRPEQLTLI